MNKHSALLSEYIGDIGDVWFLCILPGCMDAVMDENLDAVMDAGLGAAVDAAMDEGVDICCFTF